MILPVCLYVPNVEAKPLTSNGVLTLAGKDIKCEEGYLQVECIYNTQFYKQ